MIDIYILFTYIEKLSYIEKVPKFVDIEKTDANSLENLIQELNDMNILGYESAGLTVHPPPPE